jgi:hypothetical protein
MPYRQDWFLLSSVVLHIKSNRLSSYKRCRLKGMKGDSMLSTVKSSFLVKIKCSSHQMDNKENQLNKTTWGHINNNLFSS